MDMNEEVVLYVWQRKCFPYKDFTFLIYVWIYGLDWFVICNKKKVVASVLSLVYQNCLSTLYSSTSASLWLSVIQSVSALETAHPNWTLRGYCERAGVCIAVLCCSKFFTGALFSPCLGGTAENSSEEHNETWSDCGAEQPGILEDRDTLWCLPGDWRDAFSFLIAAIYLCKGLFWAEEPNGS